MIEASRAGPSPLSELTTLEFKKLPTTGSSISSRQMEHSKGPGGSSLCSRLALDSSSAGLTIFSDFLLQAAIFPSPQQILQVRRALTLFIGCEALASAFLPRQVAVGL